MEDNVYEAPKADLNTGNDGERLLASRWNRLWAGLIDALCIAIVVYPLMYFTGGFDGVSQGQQPSVMYTLLVSLAGIVVFVLINAKMLIGNGQTVGKKVLGIKIVTVANTQADLPVLLKRYGFYWFVSLIPVVGPYLSLVNMLFIFGKAKRCLHDYVADTMVIKS